MDKHTKKCADNSIIDILTDKCVSLKTEKGIHIKRCQDQGMVYDPEVAGCADITDVNNVSLRRRFAQKNTRLKKVKESKLPKDIQCYRSDGMKKACSELDFCSYSEDSKKCVFIDSLTPLGKAVHSLKLVIKQFPKETIVAQKMLEEHGNLSRELERRKKEIVMIKLKYIDGSSYDTKYLEELMKVCVYLRKQMIEIEKEIMSKNPGGRVQSLQRRDSVDSLIGNLDALSMGNAF